MFRLAGKSLAVAWLLSGNKTAVKQSDIEKMEASPISLMPEGLTTGMSDADLKDFFAYLMRK